MAVNRTGDESVRRHGLKHTVTIDPDSLLDQILEVFVEYNDWLTFRQLASRLTGDQSNADLIAGVVHRHSRVLIVNDGCRCKLREDADAFESPALTKNRHSTH
jgi:hypothetical protein